MQAAHQKMFLQRSAVGCKQRFYTKAERYYSNFLLPQTGKNGLFTSYLSLVILFICTLFIAVKMQSVEPKEILFG
jgi:hypothetical protein